MRIVVRLEWKMKRSSEISREMERASGAAKAATLFGRNDWINVQYRLTNHFGAAAKQVNATRPPQFYSLEQKRDLCPGLSLSSSLSVASPQTYPK